MSTSLIVLIVAAVLFMFVVGIYNKLVTLRNGFKNAFAQIDVQLKRRYDLIPNLVETAKGYMKHEKETLETVIAMRNTAAAASKEAASNPADPAAMQKLLSAEGQLTGALGRFYAVAEGYPDLKANQNMSQLMGELTNTENMISGARGGYNDAVTSYNNAREVFPNNIIAGMFNFAAGTLFEVTNAQEKEAPKVSFG